MSRQDQRPIMADKDFEKTLALLEDEGKKYDKVVHATLRSAA